AMKYILCLPLLITASLAVPLADTRKPGQPARNQSVRVVTISQAELSRQSGDLFEETMARLEQAASFRPDIACLPELFPNRPPHLVPGPINNRLAKWARQHSSYVIFGMKTKAGEQVFNSALLIDREGQLPGKYAKIHPTEQELADETTPGEIDP